MKKLSVGHAAAKAAGVSSDAAPIPGMAPVPNMAVKKMRPLSMMRAASVVNAERKAERAIGKTRKKGF